MSDNKITLKKSTSHRLIFDITTDPDDFDLSGYSLIFQVKKKPDEEPLLDKTCTITNNQAILDLSPSDTNHPEGEYLYGTRLHLDSTHSYPYIDDILIIEPAVVSLPPI